MSMQWGIKAFVHESWRTVCQLQGRKFDDSLEQDNPEFLQTVVQYGDLDAQEAWEKAFASLQAEIYLYEDEPQFLVENLIHNSREYGWRHLLSHVLEQILRRPQGLENVHGGLIDLRESGWMLGEPDSEGLAIIQEMTIACQPEVQIQRLEQQILQGL